jgi:hypothetical protein
MKIGKNLASVLEVLLFVVFVLGILFIVFK